MAHDPDAHIELSWSADLTRGTAQRPAVVADGALHQRGQLAAAQRRQGAGPAAAQQPRARRPGCGRRLLLPVAGVTSRGREVPLGDAAARRHRQPGLARGSRPRCLARRHRRGGRLHGARPRSQSSWTGTPGGPASWTATPRRDLEYLDRHLALYRALWDAGVIVDMVGPEADLTGYRLVLVPTLYLSHRRRRRPTSARTSTAAAPPWSPTGAASSTRTTTSGSAAIPAPSATCSGCGRRSSRRCDRVSRCGSREVFSTVPRPTCGPSSLSARRPRVVDLRRRPAARRHPR